MMAITARQPKRGNLIHHSDRGVQYACNEYAEILAVHDIQPSMSRVGNPYDNAKAESFMKTLKQEEIHGSSYRKLSQARSAIGAFIETDADFESFFRSLVGLLKPLLPRFAQEGKSYLTIAVGCTGGKHRSVFVAEKLAAALRAEGARVAVAHRDIKSVGE